MPKTHTFYKIFILATLVLLSQLTFATVEEPPKPTIAEESPSEMRRRLLSTVESADQYQKAMDHQLESLKQQNQDLHQKLNQLKTHFESVMSDVSSASQSISTSKPSTPTESIHKNDLPAEIAQPKTIDDKEPMLKENEYVLPSFSQKLFQAMFNLKVLAGIVIFIFLLFLWFRGKKGKEKPRNQKETKSTTSQLPSEKPETESSKAVLPIISANQEGEYDYIGSLEGIPARLDLANMYISMSDYASAEAVLKTVIAQGDPNQQEEAKELFEKMKAELVINP